MINPDELGESLLSGDITPEEALGAVAEFLSSIDTVDMTGEEKKILDDNLLELL